VAAGGVGLGQVEQGSSRGRTSRKAEVESGRGQAGWRSAASGLIEHGPGGGRGLRRRLGQAAVGGARTDRAWVGVG
jgi:hypothetical protein